MSQNTWDQVPTGAFMVILCLLFLTLMSTHSVTHSLGFFIHVLFLSCRLMINRLIPVLIYSLLHALVHSFLLPLLLLFIFPSTVHVCTQLLTHSSGIFFSHWFLHSLIPTCAHLFIASFMHLFITLWSIGFLNGSCIF